MYFPTSLLVSSRVSGGAARARMLGYPDEHVTASGPEVELKLRERSDELGQFSCYLCGTELDADSGWHLDHLIPLALFGAHATDNLEVACVGCNLTKSDKPLREFVGETVYATFVAHGWPPPFRALRDRPVEELWAIHHATAKAFAMQARDVPLVDSEHWLGPAGVDAKIARVLVAQGGGWRRAMPVSELADALDLATFTSLRDNYWHRSMGFVDAPTKVSYSESRLRPSPLIIPVRMGRNRRSIGWRLRDRNARAVAAVGASNDLQIDDRQSFERTFPHHDERRAG